MTTGIKTLVLPYKPGSASASALAEALEIKKFKLSNRSPRRNPADVLVNWGNSQSWWDSPLYHHGVVLNPPDSVAQASCKLTCLEILSEAGVRVPEFFTAREEAIQALEQSNGIIITRTILKGNSGQGIVVCSNPDELPEARLYTQYVKKQDEYRVHVAQGKVIDVQRKARKSDVPDSEVNWKIRNLAGGFIYAREGLSLDTVPMGVIQQSVNATKALNLDFGAVDVIWNAHQSKSYVLEVNTAPGLEGTTLQRYKQALSQMIRGEYITSVWDSEQNIQASDELSEEPEVQSIQDEEIVEEDRDIQRHLLEHRIQQIRERLNALQSDVSGLMHELELLQEL